MNSINNSHISGNTANTQPANVVPPNNVTNTIPDNYSYQNPFSVREGQSIDYSRYWPIDAEDSEMSQSENQSLAFSRQLQHGQASPPRKLPLNAPKSSTVQQNVSKLKNSR